MEREGRGSYHLHCCALCATHPLSFRPPIPPLPSSRLCGTTTQLTIGSRPHRTPPSRRTIQLGRLGNTIDAEVADELCASATQIANHLHASAIFCYTNRGNMAGFVSRQRPDCPIFAFTSDASVAKKMNLRWGVIPFRIDFDSDPESNVERSFR